MDESRTKESRKAAAAPKNIFKNKIRRHLPVGKGPYTVGCVDFMNDHTEEGVFFRLFYPTKKSDIYKRDRQWPLWLPRKQYGHGYVYFLGRNIKTFGKFFNWYVGDVYVPALSQAPVLKMDNMKYPVIILSHGLGGNRTTYSTLCCELASHGFVVAAIEHSDGSASMALRLKEFFNNNINNNNTEDSTDSHSSPESPASAFTPPSPDTPQRHRLQHLNTFNEDWKPFEKVEDIFDFKYRNGQIYHRSEECSKVLDLLIAMDQGELIHNVFGVMFDTSQFKNCLDLSKASVIGHSFGGSTCLCTLATDKRFKTGVVVDGWMHPLDEQVYKNVTQPVLMINYETFQWLANVKQMSRFVTKTMITVRGTCHQSISDFQFIANPVIARIMRVRHSLTPKLAFGTSAKGMLGYLRKHLGLPGDQHSDIFDGDHDLVINGTNLKLS
ncbi:hypothetical protein SNE40_021496 [Patella caerulea]|uniref:1-alkyl-2-acetylglycerophosphocholine esterase n=1 Tax=Patella caerulea TaxID=87958 RepID=A0AAN8IXL6_PATCE